MCNARAYYIHTMENQSGRWITIIHSLLQYYYRLMKGVLNGVRVPFTSVVDIRSVALNCDDDWAVHGEREL